MSYASLLKRLSSKSSDTLQLAVKNVLSEKDREQFESCLVKLNEFVETPESGRSDGKKTKQHDASNRTQRQQFIDFVVPKIQAMMAERDNNEKSTKLSDSTCDWKLDLGFVDTFNKGKIVSLDDLKAVHLDIVKQETIISNIQLVAAYFRGLVYVRARTLAPVDVAIEEFMYTTFNVAYKTVCRYISFVNLIDCYPGLMICQLTFSQIIQHRNDLLSHLQIDKTLATKLRLYVTIKAHGKPVDLEATQDVCERTNIKFDCSPNWSFEHDSKHIELLKPASTEIASQATSHSGINSMDVEDDDELLNQMDKLCQTE